MPATSPARIDCTTLTADQLLDTLAHAGDCAPIELIDACVDHGAAMVDALQAFIESERAWDTEDRGDWWLLLHAAFVLGRMPSAAAGSLLIRLMYRIQEHGDDNAQDWLAGYWPALFANKPPDTATAARRLAEDRAARAYLRAQALDIVLDAALRESPVALEAALDWQATWLADEHGDWNFRLLAACAMLGFPRERHRALLESIVEEQDIRSELFRMFDRADIERAFALGRDEPDWQRFANPWAFYEPQAIAQRQQRWLEEAATEAPTDSHWEEVSLPYVRPTPKVGRNDPCPCGSGQKYKRCCLSSAA